MSKNRSLRSGRVKPANVRTGSNRKHWHRPKFESLESRRLLAVYAVNSFLDTIDANLNDGIAADASGQTSLRAAVMQANASPGADTIHLPAGTYQLNISGSGEDAAATGDLDITDDLTIVGAGASNTVIDAGGDTGLLDRIFDIPNSIRESPGSFELHELTLQGGRVYSSGTTDFNSGGAIDVGFFNNVVVTNAQFLDNRVNSIGRGGAIHNNGVLTVSDSVFEENSASSSGGALFTGGNTGTSASNQFEVMAAIRDSSLSNNVSGNGGAISSHAALFIESTTIDNNVATRNGQGGGIELQSSIFSSLQLTNSTVSGNHGRYGGGIMSTLGSSGYHSLEINNSTIAENHADIQGGGLSLSSVGGAGVRNSILANNSVGNPTFVGVGPDIRGTVNSTGNNLISDDAGVLGGLLGSDLVNVDPQLGSLADNGGTTQTHALLFGSPAIDAANNLTAAATDQRGIARPQGTGADIGSFELAQSAPIAVDDVYSVSEDGALIVDGPGQPVLHYSFDSDVSAGQVSDLGQAPKADGQLIGSATTTNSTPGGYSNAALDLTSETNVSFVSDGDADKIDQMTEMTATFWLNLQADPNEGDVLLSDMTSFPADPFTSGWELRITGPATGVSPTADDFRLEFETAHIGSSLANAQAAFKGPVDADNQWVFVAISFSESGLFSWYTGDETSVPASLGQTNFVYTMTGFDNPSDLRIGSSSSSDPSVDRTPPAWFDDVRIYDRVLTGGELDDVRLANVGVVATGVLDNDVDAEGNLLSVVLVDQPSNGTLLMRDNGSFNYFPNDDFSGADTFTYRASDGDAQSNLATVTINVEPLPDPPIAVNDNAETNEGTAVNIPVLSNDNDPDSDPLTVVSVTDPANGSVSIVDATTILYTPNPGFSGTDSFVYQASDGELLSNQAEVSVRVIDVNERPDAVNDDITTNEDTEVVFDLLQNDSDPDDDVLTLLRTTEPAFGQISIDSNQLVTYVPDEDFSGSDSFIYTIGDGNGGFDSATVTITVNPINDDPVAVADIASTNEDTSVAINVLSNDSDIDSANLTVTGVVTGPVSGIATVGTDGAINYVPNENFNGSDSFTYAISDGNGGTATASVNVTVNPINDDPVAVADLASTDEDTSVAINVLSNDSDIDSANLTVTGIVTAPVSGIATVGTDGAINYVPNENFNGSDSFTYAISDGNGGTATASVNVTVNPINDDPVAVADLASTDEDTSVAINVLSNDSDIDSANLTVTGVVTGPVSGIATVGTDGAINYVPNENFNGSDSFTYAISDGNGGTATAEVSITVNSINDAPVALDDSFTVPESGGQLNVLANDVDAEDDSLVASIATPPLNGTIEPNADGTLTYVPNAGFSGIDSFTYVANDGDLQSNLSTVQVNVESGILSVDFDLQRRRINLKSNGKISLAILGTSSLDASDLDASSIQFVGIAAESWTLEDIDGDGDSDLVLKFSARALRQNLTDLYFASEATGRERSVNASLTGNTIYDQAIEGLETINLFLAKQSRGKPSK